MPCADVVKELLQALPELSMTVDASNTTALNTAATQGHMEVVRLLLQVDGSLALIARSNGKTARGGGARAARGGAQHRAAHGQEGADGATHGRQGHPARPRRCAPRCRAGTAQRHGQQGQHRAAYRVAQGAPPGELPVNCKFDNVPITY
jgi:hypothetical protein